MNSQHAVVETKMTACLTKDAIQRVKIGGAGMRHGRSTLVVGDKGRFETGLFESSTDGRRISGEAGSFNVWRPPVSCDTNQRLTHKI